MPEIDLSRSVYELTEEHPEVITILRELGFRGIANPITRQTIGRHMTIPAGCKLRKVSLETVVARLRDAGFTVTGGENTDERTDQ